MVYLHIGKTTEVFGGFIIDAFPYLYFYNWKFFSLLSNNFGKKLTFKKGEKGQRKKQKRFALNFEDV